MKVVSMYINLSEATVIARPPTHLEYRLKKELNISF